MDAINTPQLGERFGCLTTGKDVSGIIQTLESTLFYAARVGIYSFLHPILFWFNMLVNAKGMGYLLNFVQDIVTTRMGKPLPDGKDENAPEDFITKFQRIRQENPEKINKDDIMASAIANISAGSDTTSISLTSVIFHLCKFPDVLAKLRNELENAVRRGDITDPITFKQAQNMPYLQAVIKEALRIHPATGLILGRVVPDGGATIAGRFFPAGVSSCLLLSYTQIYSNHDSRPQSGSMRGLRAGTRTYTERMLRCSVPSAGLRTQKQSRDVKLTS